MIFLTLISKSFFLSSDMNLHILISLNASLTNFLFSSLISNEDIFNALSYSKIAILTFFEF